MSNDPTDPELSAEKLAAIGSREFVEFMQASFAKSLDFSVDSLRLVDDYLEKIHARNENQLGFFGKLFSKKFSDSDIWHIVAHTGFYTGEVVRRKISLDHRWFRFGDWIALNPGHIEILGAEPGMGTMFILGNNEGDMCLPLGKAAKFIANGREDSVYYFAQMFMTPSSETE